MAMLNPHSRYRDVLEAGVMAMDAMPDPPSLDASRSVSPSLLRLSGGEDGDLTPIALFRQPRMVAEGEGEDGSGGTVVETETESEVESESELGEPEDVDADDVSVSSQDVFAAEVDTWRTPLPFADRITDIPLAPVHHSRCPSRRCFIRRMEEDAAARLRGLAERIERGQVTWDSMVLAPYEVTGVVQEMMSALEDAQRMHRPWSEETRQVVLNTEWTLVNAHMLPAPLREEYFRRRGQGQGQGQEGMDMRATARYVFTPPSAGSSSSSGSSGSRSQPPSAGAGALVSASAGTTHWLGLGLGVVPQGRRQLRASISLDPLMREMREEEQRRNGM
jgi:hypothetical protein